MQCWTFSVCILKSLLLRFQTRISALIVSISEENFIKLVYSLKLSVQIHQRRLHHWIWGLKKNFFGKLPHVALKELKMNIKATMRVFHKTFYSIFWYFSFIPVSNLKKPAQQQSEVETVDFNSFSDDGSKLYFKKLSDNATTPLRGSRNAAGNIENKISGGF